MRRIPIKNVFENHQWQWFKVVGGLVVSISHDEFALLAEANREYLRSVYGAVM
jgi:hypothetical protein